MIDIILVTIGLIGLVIGTVTDIKKREVPDWLNYSMISSGLGLRLINSLATLEWYYFLYGLLGFGIFLALAYLMFYSGQWGGGDSKMLIGLGAIFATYPAFLLGYFNPKLNLPFLIIFIINTLLAGAIYGTVYSAVLVLKNKRKFLVEMNKVLNRKIVKASRNSILIISIIFVIIIYFTVNFIVIPSILLVLVFILTFYLWVFSKAVEKACMYKFVTPNKLVEGDWIAKNIYVRKKLIAGPKDLGIEKHQIEQLKKSRIKRILIKEGIPFVPSFLVGIIVSLVFGNWIWLFV